MYSGPKSLRAQRKTINWRGVQRVNPLWTRRFARSKYQSYW